MSRSSYENGAGFVLDMAIDYQRAGFSIIPVKRDGRKEPALDTWKELQLTPLDEPTVRRLWSGSNPPGIGILSGRVSGGKELLDFDRDATIIFPQWRDLVEDACPGLVERLCLVRTPRPGFHIHYRVVDFIIPGNQALARIPAEKEPDAKKRVLIETRGEGGYALAPGTPGACHETGRTYEHIGGPPLTDIPTITEDERAVLIEMARAFDQSAYEAPRPRTKPGQDLRPGDDFDLNGWTWPELLEPQGWRIARISGNVTYWTRPGKDRGVSASTGYCRRQRDGAALLHVFTSSMPPLEPAKCYSKFAFFVLTQVEGDWIRGASLIRGQGFGNNSQSTPGSPVVKDVPFPEPTSWPDPPGVEAFHGLPGLIVRTIDPASEASTAALLVQTLVAFGNAIGRGAHFVVESDRHHANEFVVLVGKTSKARKGTSWGQVVRLYREAEEIWSTERILSGLSSGEGLIWAVRDPITKREKIKEKGQIRYEEVEADPGVEDKRLLIVEPEFANVLKQTERQGNTLSTVLRLAWDGQDLRTLTKNSPAHAKGAHVSLIGHVTADELRRYLTATESANGFGNRHLWICTDRSKLLPEGGTIDSAAWNGLREELVESLRFGRSVGAVTRDAEAREVWCDIYSSLSEGKPGLAGALLARAEAHVLRLAMIYALMDRSAVIQAHHILAAMALWDYAERSVYFIFGDCLGDSVADDLLRLMRASPNGLTRTEMMQYFSRHQSSDRIGRALGLLLQHRLARREQQETGGRPSERWFATSTGQGT